MFWLYMYSLFALTTALTATYELLHPVIMERIETHKKVESKYVMYVTFFLMSLLIAPAIIFSCIIPSVGNTFRKHLSENIFQD